MEEFPQRRQSQRPARRRSSSSRETSSDSTPSSGAPSSASIWSSASACGEGPGEAVSRKWSLSPDEPLADHPDDDLVGHQLTCVHVALRLGPEGRARRARRAQEVAGGEVREAALPTEPLRLRPFAGSGRPEDEEAGYRRNPSYWRCSSWASVWRMVSSATPTTISSEVPPKKKGRVGEVLEHQVRQRRDKSQVDRARKGEAGDHPVEEDRRRPARANAGDEPAVLLEVLRLVNRVELDRRVEVGEEADQQRLQRMKKYEFGSIQPATFEEVAVVAATGQLGDAG